VWTKPHANWKKYTEIAVRPVNVEALIRNTDQESGDGSAGTLQARALGAHMEQALKEALSRYPPPRLQLVDAPGPKTVVVDASLVGTDPALVGVQRIGMETELRDGTSGEIIVAIGDREVERPSPGDSPAATNDGGAEPIIDEWAMQIAGLVNSRRTYAPPQPVHHFSPAIMSWGH
jgi:hypothetical protein